MQAILLILVTFDFNSSKISTITSIGSAYIGSSTTYTVDSDITGIIIVQTANDDRSNAFCTVSEGICNEMLNQTIHRSGYASQLAIYNISIPANTVITFGSSLCTVVRGYLCTLE